MQDSEVDNGKYSCHQNAANNEHYDTLPEQDCMSTKFGIFATAERKIVSQKRILSMLST